MSTLLFAQSIYRRGGVESCWVGVNTPLQIPLNSAAMCISSPGHRVHLQGSSKEASLPGGHEVPMSTLLLRHICWELEKKHCSYLRSYSYKALRDNRSQLSSDFLRLKKLHVWENFQEPVNWLCRQTHQRQKLKEAAKAWQRLARRGCESETSPGEPGIAHHSAQSYSNTKRQDNQSF